MKGKDNNTVSGRSEQVNTVKGVSSTYACYNCCPDSFFDGWVTPLDVYSFPDDISLFQARQRNTNCYGYLLPEQSGDIVYYSSSDYDIAYTNYFSGSTTAGNAGLATIYGSWTADSWRLDIHGYMCEYTPVEVIREGYMEVAPRANISSFKAVGKGQKAIIRVQVSNNPSGQSITLNLSPSSGTGAARFTSTNSATRPITQTEDVEIEGVTESSTKENMRMTATFNNRQLDDEDFTVISVTLSLRFSNNQTVSNDNSARSNQQTANGTVQLGGPFLTSGTGNIVWGHAVEIVGTILPSNFSESIVLQREVVASQTYRGNVLISSQGCNPPTNTPCPDTSFPEFRDDNPQSGGSNGKVYDIDTPGMNRTGATPGLIFRRRTNFRQWATISQLQGGSTADVRVSEDLEWFQRLSIVINPNGTTSIINDVSGDNVVNTGNTRLTWDLQ